MPVYENERGTFLFNSKDLCMIEHVPEMIEAGIDSFKIEGRMKTALYVATVARTYRKAIDDYLESPEAYRGQYGVVQGRDRQVHLPGVYDGLLLRKAHGARSQIYDNSTYVKNYIYLGTVEEKDGRSFAKIEQKNKFSVGETIEIMKPDGRNIEVQVRGIFSEDGEPRESAPHPKEILYVDLSGEADVYDILRKKDE